MWPFRHKPAQPTTEALAAQQQAEQAQATAQEGLRNELQRGPEVTRVTESLRRGVLDNHLSASMERLIVRSVTHHEP